MLSFDMGDSDLVDFDLMDHPRPSRASVRSSNKSPVTDLFMVSTVDNSNRPPIPYRVGTKLELQSHTPPPPIGRPYPATRPIIPALVVRNGSQLDICLSNPPLEGPAGHATEKRTLAITGEIAVKDGRGAQVVVGNNRVVAKIYDPLYYLHNDGSVVRAIDDFTFLADSDYTREAAAYNELKAKFGGNEIPYFFGSWTCNISTPTPLGLKIRPVRLILIEYLQGTSLLELKPTLFSEQDRINIVARAMEASVAILHEGVHHRDFSPRNVMYCKLTDGKSIKSEPRIVIIDFGLSVVDRLASGTRHKDLFNLPTSPLTCYSGDTVDFSDLGWLPTSKDWMWARWDGSSQYKPVPDHIRKRRNEGPKDVQSILAKFLSK